MKPANVGYGPISIGADTTLFLPVFAGDDGLLAVDGSGATKWFFPTEGDPQGALVTQSGDVIIQSRQHLYAVHPNGDLAWSKPIDGGGNLTGYGAVATPSIAPDGTIYVGVAGGSQDGQLLAFTPAGALQWTFDCQESIYATPAVGPDGAVYVLASGVFHDLFAIEPDGTARWQIELEGQPTGTTIAADGGLFVGTYAGQLIALLPSGETRWTYQAGSPLSGGLALGADGTVYAGDDNGVLHAVSPEGTLRWKASVSGAVRGAPVIDANGHIYVATASFSGVPTGSILGVNADGTLAWEMSTASAIAMPMALGGDGTLHALSFAGELVSVAP